MEDGRTRKNISRFNNIIFSVGWLIYGKLFTEHYRVWREREIKKGRGKRFPPTYYEKIEQDKQKHLCYEIIWQIGNMRDTGFVYTPEDANRAQDLLDEFTKYMEELLVLQGQAMIIGLYKVAQEPKDKRLLYYAQRLQRAA